MENKRGITGGIRLIKVTVDELENKYKERVVQKINDDIIVVDLYTDETHSSSYHIKLMFAYNKLFTSGDYGAFTFGKNICNIFNFFKGDKINVGYWQEKVEASPRDLRVIEVDANGVYDDVIDWYEDGNQPDDEELIKEEKSKIEDFIIGSPFSSFDTNAYRAFDSLYDFLKEEFDIDDHELVADIIDSNRGWDGQFIYILYVIQWVSNNLEKWQSE